MDRCLAIRVSGTAAVSLTSLDQAGIKLFDPSNASDADGLTRLTEQIESRKKKRNDIEKDTTIAIGAKNPDAEKRSLEIRRDAEYARLDHAAEVAIERARRRLCARTLARSRGRRGPLLSAIASPMCPGRRAFRGRWPR